MKQKNRFAYLQLFGLPAGLSFVLFCSLLGSLVGDTTLYHTIALSLTSNLAFFAFTQAYKHLSYAPEDMFSPTRDEPNPISLGQVSLLNARIGLYLSLVIALVSAFALNRVNVILLVVAVIFTVALYHPNIRFSNRVMLSLSQRNFLLSAFFFLNSIWAGLQPPSVIELFFPLLFITSFYLLFGFEEARTASPQQQTTQFWLTLISSTLIISGGITFLLLGPVPYWIIALWLMLAAIQLIFARSVQTDPIPSKHPLRLKALEIAGAVSSLVYLIFRFINLN